MILRQYLHQEPVIERRFNRAFALSNEQEFVNLMLRDVPPRPPRAAEIRASNLGAMVAATV